MPLAHLKVPFGYNLFNGRLVKNDHEQRVLAHLELWWAEGKSYDDMAEKLNLMNIPSKRNRIWKGATINRILARERGD